MSHPSPKNKSVSPFCAKRRRWRPPVIKEEKPPAVQEFLFEDISSRPLIIPRPDHCVSRKNIDREALKVLYRLKDHGFIAYLVGGSVRDLLLKKRPKDFDIGTNARPEEVKRLFRYSRIIGKRFRLVHVYFKGGKVIEVSTFRRQTDYDDREAIREGMGNEDIFGSPQEDAFRRDLTINGLFYNIADFSVIDFVGGMKDLRAGIIRVIGDPERRFLRDPVRMLRAVRHAARTGFEIEPATWKAIRANADKIRLCAVPRVRDEWLKDLRSGVSCVWAELMLKAGLLKHVFMSYSPVLESESAETTRTMLMGLLRRIDAMVGSGQEVSEALILAVLAYPVLNSMPGWHNLRTEKLRWPTFEVRSLIHEIFLPYDFRRAVRDQTAQILSSQWALSTCVARNSWPKRVWRKSTFNEALLLFDWIREIYGLSAVGPAPHLRPRPAKALRKRRQRSRGRGKRNKG